MDHQELQNLFERYRRGIATQREITELMKVLRNSEMEEPVKEILAKEIELLNKQPIPESVDISKERIEALLCQIMSEKEAPVIQLYQNKRRRIVWYAAAAVIILGIGISTFLMRNKNTIEKPVAKEQINTDILPGHDGAVLTLADGTKIILDNAQDGKITDVAVKNGNTVSYQKSSPARIEYNTMTTPKGRQFTLVLPDGTQVWLNAASSITYPTAFVGNARKVSITGEAYFEVAHNASKPFHVNVNGMDVQVLGTHFNINSYADEGPIRATLLQGSIRVSVAGKTQMVKPGQQAQVANNDITLIPDADVDAVMAWKNGFFSFENADIKEIMKQLTKWYDVEVIYQGEPKERFAGKIDRNLTLSQVLKGLSETKVHFRIEDGKRLIILP
jgi:ferric-dicitrate binding protein FerR (iron transport regulator)